MASASFRLWQRDLDTLQPSCHSLQCFMSDTLKTDVSCLLRTLIFIQQDLFSSQSVNKSKDASLLPSKLPTSVLLFDDEDEEVNIVIITQDNQVFD